MNTSSENTTEPTTESAAPRERSLRFWIKAIERMAAMQGRAGREKFRALLDSVEDISAEEIATTTATLEKLARALGWEEGMRLPRRERGHGRTHGFGRGHGGPEHTHGLAPQRHQGHEHNCHRGHKHDHPMAQHAFERGFTAGFHQRHTH